MCHADETLQRWQELERVENAYRRWAAFFYPLLGDAEAAEALCAIGLQVVRRELGAGAAARTRFESAVRRPIPGCTACAQPATNPPARTPEGTEERA